MLRKHVITCLIQKIRGAQGRERVHTTLLKCIYAYGILKNIVMKYKVPALQY